MIFFKMISRFNFLITYFPLQAFYLQKREHGEEGEGIEVPLCVEGVGNSLFTSKNTYSIKSHVMMYIFVPLLKSKK